MYKIPPLKQNEGHRANDWGDLASPLWKGRLRIIEKGADVALYFEDSTTGACLLLLWESTRANDTTQPIVSLKAPVGVDGG